MSRKVLALFLVGFLAIPSVAKAGALDVLNKVGNIAQAINDTQRTLSGGKPDGPVAAGGSAKRSSGARIISKRHK